MAYTVRFSGMAAGELELAFDWLKARSPIAALRWYEQIAEAIQSLADNPERCALAPENEWYQGELRQLLHGKRRNMYRVLFEVRGNVVHILRVRHCAQDLLKPGEIRHPD